jgi:exonuclease III
MISVATYNIHKAHSAVHGCRISALKDALNEINADIICLQETKAFEHQLPAEFRYHLNDYNRVWHSGEKP